MDNLANKISAINVPSNLNTFVYIENVLLTSINDFCNYVENNLNEFDKNIIYTSQADISNLNDIKSINFKYWLVLIVSVISMIILYLSKVAPFKASDINKQYYILIDSLFNNINRCFKTSTLNK
ncbi:hypothetical protein [Clostridium botulinum]|uniref:hypothetical protein n=1 Tax=Clostridium botulinum TaxID=1491 RepID=UPI001E4C7896|nr:hypothetical protein [Clostridium botulinum]